MGNRRSCKSRINQAELNELVFRLQALLPRSRQYSTANANNSRDGTSRVLSETCRYIRKLHREVDGLSERISGVLDSMEANGLDLETIRSLLN